MDVNINKLKGKIVEAGYTQDTLAEKIHMDKSTLNRKLKTGESFSIGQANEIARVLKLTKEEAISIFFASIVA